MTNKDILKMLKSNLEIINTLNDEYLSNLIEVAKKEIEREGIVFVTTQVPVETTDTPADPVTDPTDPTDPSDPGTDPGTDPSDPDPDPDPELEPETETSYEFDDANLIVMYAAYLYRNRVNDAEAGYKTKLSSTGMPRMLRYALNNRIFSQKRTNS